MKFKQNKPKETEVVQAQEVAPSVAEFFTVQFNNKLTDSYQDGRIKDFIKSEVKKLYPDGDTYHSTTTAVFNSIDLTYFTKEGAMDMFNIFNKELTRQSGIYACVVSSVDGLVVDNATDLV